MVVLLMVSYGSVDCLQNIAAKVQRQPCLAITETISTTPRIALKALLNRPLLYLRMEAAARAAT